MTDIKTCNKGENRVKYIKTGKRTMRIMALIILEETFPALMIKTSKVTMLFNVSIHLIFEFKKYFLQYQKIITFWVIRKSTIEGLFKVLWLTHVQF